MSAEDNFEIVLEGMGSHAACPHWGREVLVAACALVMDLQTIVSRRLSPTDVGVVSVTELLTDGTRNVLPGLARKQTNRQHYKSLREYLDHHNAHLTPFVWTKSATNILEKVARGRRALESQHEAENRDQSGSQGHQRPQNFASKLARRVFFCRAHAACPSHCNRRLQCSGF